MANAKPAPAESGVRVESSFPAEPGLMERLRPTRRSGMLLLYGVIAALLLVGLLFVVNVVVPIGEGSLLRTVTTVVLLVGAWAVAVGMLAASGLRALRPAVATTLVLLPPFVLLATMAIWRIGPYTALGRVAAAFALLLLFALFCAPAVEALMRRRDVPLAALSIAVIAVAGIALAIDLAGARFSSAATESLWRGSVGITLGSLLLLLPAGTRKWPRWLAWAAVAQLALAGALDPWVGGDRSARLNAATFVLLAVFGFTALTFALLPARDNAMTPGAP